MFIPEKLVADTIRQVGVDRVLYGTDAVQGARNLPPYVEAGSR
jgi:hypothetical protein